MPSTSAACVPAVSAATPGLNVGAGVNSGLGVDAGWVVGVGELVARRPLNSVANSPIAAAIAATAAMATRRLSTLWRERTDGTVKSATLAGGSLNLDVVVESPQLSVQFKAQCRASPSSFRSEASPRDDCVRTVPRTVIP